MEEKGRAVRTFVPKVPSTNKNEGAPVVEDIVPIFIPVLSIRH